MTTTPLKWRLSMGIGLLALLSTLLVWQLSSSLSRQQIERDQNTLLTSIAVRMATQMAHDMDARAGELRFLASQSEIRDPRLSSEKKRAIFERMRNNYPFYSWIGITDTEGNIVAGTDGLLVGKSVAKRDWFINGRDSLHFGDAHDAFLLAKFLPKPKWDDLPLRLVDISLPVHDEQGRLLGVICGHLSLDWAFEARESMLDQLNREHLDLIVLNKEGKVLMGTPRLPSLKVDLASLTSFQGLAHNSRQVANEQWPDGRNYLTAAVRETPFRNYQGMGWTIVARKPLDIALQAADQLSRLILIAGIGTALLFALAGWIVLNRLLRPLEQVAQVAERIKAHDLTTEIPQPAGDDEVSVLARSLTELVASLQAANAELQLSSRVFEESGQGILISDTNNRVLRVNRAFVQITGYPAAEILGQTPAVLQSGMQDKAFYQAMWQRLARHGQWQGEIWNKHKDGHRYPEWLTIYTLRDEQGQVAYYLAIFDDITEKKNYERRLVHLANYDTLTELPNRHLLQERTDRMLREATTNAQQLALIFIDLDRFKLINDTLGHPAGDTVLVDVARRFSLLVGNAQLLARWGGDEFVIVMPIKTADDAAHMAQNVANALHAPFIIAGEAYQLSMSAGIACFPNDGQSVAELLRCADTAMYQAKQAGRGEASFFTPTMNSELTQTVHISHALRLSLEHKDDSLSLVFQPKLDLHGQAVVGIDILARWQHPQQGEVSPTQFIQIAEDNGLMPMLSQWLIEHSVRQISSIRQALGRALPFSLNLSAHQLRDTALPRQLQGACLQNELPCRDLTLEVTENAIMADEKSCIDNLLALKSLGFRLSIDNYGTAYASLNYLQTLRPAEIKIDRRLVDNLPVDPEYHERLQFIISMADKLGLNVVATGVENERQWQALQPMAPWAVQGFLFARPMTEEALVSYMQAHPLST
ncbi:MAG: EAL domain-containing protein [Dechloromonas sp.]|nr:EAL domain-containing protein [Dechloromonas sp.]